MSYFSQGKYTSALIFTVTALLTAGSLLVTGTVTLSGQTGGGALLWLNDNKQATSTNVLTYATPTSMLRTPNVTVTDTATTTKLCLSGDICRTTWPSTTETDTLQVVLNRGPHATTTGIRIFGNVTTTNIATTGTANFLGMVFAGASGTSLNLTDNFSAGSSTVTKLDFTGATGTSLHVAGSFSAGSSTVTTVNFTNATGSSLDVSTAIRIAGTNVCQEDGTNCQAGTGTPTLEEVLREGNVATSSFITYGNATTTHLAATGTLAVTGLSRLGDVTMDDATSTSLFSTSLGASTAYLTGLGTFQAITFAGATGTSLSISGSFNAGSSTVTTFNFSNATGSSLTLSGPASSTLLFANSATLATATIGGQSVCLADGTNCPTTYSNFTITNNLTVRNIKDISGGLASSTVVLSGGSGAITATVPIPTSTTYIVNEFPMFTYQMNATSTNCIYWGPFWIRDSWNGGTMKPILQLAHASGTGVTIWRLRGETSASGTYLGAGFTAAKAYATSSAIQGAFATNIVMQDLTIGSAATGTAMKMELCREGDNGQDTLGADAYPLSVKLEYAISSYSD